MYGKQDSGLKGVCMFVGADPWQNYTFHLMVKLMNAMRTCQDDKQQESES